MKSTYVNPDTVLLCCALFCPDVSIHVRRIRMENEDKINAVGQKKQEVKEEEAVQYIVYSLHVFHLCKGSASDWNARLDGIILGWESIKHSSYDIRFQAIFILSEGYYDIPLTDWRSFNGIRIHFCRWGENKKRKI